MTSTRPMITLIVSLSLIPFAASASTSAKQRIKQLTEQNIELEQQYYEAAKIFTECADTYSVVKGPNYDQEHFCRNGYAYAAPVLKDSGITAIRLMEKLRSNELEIKALTKN